MTAPAPARPRSGRSLAPAPRRRLGLPAALSAGLVAGLLALRADDFSWPRYLLVLLGILLAGLVLSAACAGLSLRRRERGLGELAVFLGCGPLTIAGTHLAATGALPWQVWPAAVPYGLLGASVVLGRHLDELPLDAARGVRTLPVLLGSTAARGVTIAVLVAFHATTGLAVAAGALPWPVLLVALALPTLRGAAGTLRRPGPTAAPLPARPAWFEAVCLRHAWRAGGLLVLGLLLAAVIGTGRP
jgi:1,4-dihydroxy-2-naphthoate octaprenyltransferase